MKTKMVKNLEDDCFGEKYDSIEQCEACWVKASCLAKFKNRK